ncbi:translation factor Sua5 [Deinococcus sp. Leaf326]|nr:translation factor Sua5 [Deinococcus sp. Leaf326]
MARAAEILAAGGVVGYPTEAVWGLAARPEYAAELHRRKGRELGKPVQVSCPDAPSALAWAWPSAALEALAALWPGPLTVVTAALPACPPDLAPEGQVGLRVPDHPLARALLLAAGPLATTSLNPAGRPAALSRSEAAGYALADLLLGEAGAPETPPAPGGLASTVVALPTRPGDPARVLRAGALPTEQVRAVLAVVGLALEAAP